MGPTHLHDAGLHDRGHLVRTGLGLGALVDQAGDSRGRIPAEPGMHRLAGHPIPLGHVDDGRPVENFAHGLVTLFHQSQLHQHLWASFASVDVMLHSKGGGGKHLGDPDQP